MLRLLTVGVLAAVLAAPASASAVFDWSFDNQNGAVAGSVSGYVVLPDGDGTFAALDFVIESMPAALETAYQSILGIGLPTEFADFGPGLIENTFTVSGGEIDAGPTGFIGLFNGSTAIGLATNALSGASFLDFPNAAGTGATGMRDADSSSLTFSRRAVVPVPAAAPLLAFGAVALVVAARRRRAA